MQDLLAGIQWQKLYAQKHLLLAAINYSEDHPLMGIVSLLDVLQDHAADLGLFEFPEGDKQIQDIDEAKGEFYVDSIASFRLYASAIEWSESLAPWTHVFVVYKESYGLPAMALGFIYQDKNDPAERWFHSAYRDPQAFAYDRPEAAAIALASFVEHAGEILRHSPVLRP